MNDGLRTSLSTTRRLRRRYLVARAVTSAVAVLGASVAMGLGGLMLLIAILIPKSWMMDIAWALVFGVCACYAVGGWLFLTAMDRAQALTYCPPAPCPSRNRRVDEQLLRAGAAHDHPSSDLVRPARRTSTHPAEELLRPDRSMEEADVV